MGPAAAQKHMVTQDQYSVLQGNGVTDIAESDSWLSYVFVHCLVVLLYAHHCVTIARGGRGMCFTGAHLCS